MMMQNHSHVFRTRSALRRGAAALGTVGLILAMACHDALDPHLGPEANAGPSSDGYSASVTAWVAADGSTRMRLRFQSGGLASPIGGYRVSFTLPTGVDTAAGGLEQTTAEGRAQRLVSLQGRTVHAAGITPDGFTVGDLFVVGIRGPDALRAAHSVTIHEFVDLKGVDQLARLRPMELARSK